MMTEEFDFKLPKGLIDANGELHAQGKMRLLTAKDELIVQDLSSRDRNIDIVFLLLAQAIAKLGNLQHVTAQQLEQLFLPDFVHLQDLFSQLQPQNVTASGES
jgi:Phage tail assembly chaperone proteins, E, or 41 or 14